MPGMDGLEVLQRLRHIVEVTPVVVISGHGTVSAETALQHSCNIFFYQLGAKLGANVLTDFFRDFCRGPERTYTDQRGTGLFNEHFGIIPRRVVQATWTHVYLPAPFRLTHGKRNPLAVWLGDMGLYGLRSHEKFIPAEVFALPDAQIALFLRHLWATDGSVRRDGRMGRIYYASTSRRLIES